MHTHSQKRNHIYDYDNRKRLTTKKRTTTNVHSYPYEINTTITWKENVTEKKTNNKNDDNIKSKKWVKITVKNCKMYTRV